LTNDFGYISICPLCGTYKMEWLPISYSESYRLDYDEIRGLALHFWIQNEGDENDKIVLEKELAELKLALDLLQ
jgi:hypothetical protein